MPDDRALLQEILTKLTKIETILDSVKPQLDDHEARIRELEGKSGKKWDAVSLAIITGVLVGIAGYVIGKMF